MHQKKCEIKIISCARGVKLLLKKSIMSLFYYSCAVLIFNQLVESVIFFTVQSYFCPDLNSRNVNIFGISFSRNFLTVQHVT